ncbi:hypothetical protein [Curtobacterium sp. Leaf261]|uniref:hypothetical protein n=1 Tax=Curtobacterium sp. Leaf261 TaxID=1736311 RepID=UPI0006FD214E|nr:hypothetical protein [Curtobacterium sp. Leaf261]KQO62420.1 hypothetical protein ASF23_11660 [Curtobacterium sp. Leaf261]
MDITRNGRSVHDQRFRGRIMGVGTASGLRAVVGMWRDSPLGAFTDVFLELPDGSSMLLAPNDAVAEFVSSTYRFDETRVLPVRSTMLAHADPRVRAVIDVDAGPLRLSAEVGGITPLGRLLRIVPRRIAVDPRWLAAIHPVARLIVPGAGTAGTAGAGRREFYGVYGSHAVLGVTGAWEGADVGVLAPLDPPVRFGFASMPARPQVVDVESVIREG